MPRTTRHHWIYLTSKISSDTPKVKLLIQSVESFLLFCVAVTFIPFIFLALLALRWYIHPAG